MADITYKVIDGSAEAQLSQNLLLQASAISQEFFSSDLTVEMFNQKQRTVLVVALHEKCVVGFKLGYQEKTTRFYSWLGGVAPNFQGQNIGHRLMEEQHKWCTNNGYQEITTKTKNVWRSMLILNLKNGFDIIGTYTDQSGEPKIILSKKLST